MFIRMASDAVAKGSRGLRDLDEPRVPLLQRTARAMAVGAALGATALPIAVGWQRCTVAAILHRPCPGCGMTRALKLLLAGDVGASLRMHPLALPVLAVGVLFATSTVWTTLLFGSPLRVYRTPFGRFAIGSAGVLYASALALWILRWLGLFGGPVQV
jgi:hypothetical protein